MESDQDSGPDMPNRGRTPVVEAADRLWRADSSRAGGRRVDEAGAGSWNADARRGGRRCIVEGQDRQREVASSRREVGRGGRRRVVEGQDGVSRQQPGRPGWTRVVDGPDMHTSMQTCWGRRRRALQDTDRVWRPDAH